MKESFFKRLGRFFAKNVYYIILFVCVAAIATMITFAALRSGDNPVVELPPDNIITPPPGDGEVDGPGDGPEIPVVVDPITFRLPVDVYTVGMTFSGDEFIYSVTLLDSRIHRGFDFLTDDGANVYAVYEGTVLSVEHSILFGTIVKIKHNDDLTTVYQSLNPQVNVTTGQKVQKGTKIGTTSDSFMQECMEGPHLHFEVLLNGVQVDPMEYFDLGDK